jgi:pimeloyl-ACP methyl ester carboxylesterase
LGIKVQWSEVEMEKMNRRAHSPTRHWPYQAEALENYRKASGLFSLESDCPLLLDGIVKESDGWRLAADPRTFSCGPPQMRDLITHAQCPCHLACGSEDPLVTVDQLRDYDPRSEVFDGLGHNAMVESPDVVWEWIARKTS